MYYTNQATFEREWGAINFSGLIAVKQECHREGGGAGTIIYVRKLY